MNCHYDLKMGLHPGFVDLNLQIFLRSGLVQSNSTVSKKIFQFVALDLDLDLEGSLLN